jgi:hypothetical protein
LEKWVKLNLEYAKKWQFEDVPWGYGERSCVGILAAAAWRSKGIALEEYGAKKKHAHRAGKKNEYKGRCDLYFRLQNTNFVCEAKHVSARLGLAEKGRLKRVEEIKALLSEEAAAARRNKQPRERGLGIVFVGFRMRKPKPNTPCPDLKLAARAWVKDLQNLRTRLAMARAWKFYPDLASLQEMHRNAYWYPGFAILIAEKSRKKHY